MGARSPEFDALRSALTALSDPAEPLVPGAPTRVRLDDRREIPTLATGYSEVPVTLASAGVRRVLGIAYVLVWAWTEHVKAAKLTRREPTRDVVVLIDEVELHLHPSWQRVIVPAIMNALASFEPRLSVQMLMTTHAPLVLSSLEPLFDEERDDLFHFHRDGAVVAAREEPFASQGDAANWLISEVFGLGDARSKAAELAIEAALAFMSDEWQAAEGYLRDVTSHLAQLSDTHGLSARKRDLVATLRDPTDERPLADRIHAALLAVVPDHDDIWPEWILTYRKIGDGSP